MRPRYGASVLVAILLVTLTVIPGVAALPLDIHTEVQATLHPDPDPFVAGGPVVHGGLLCETGKSVDLRVVAVPPARRATLPFSRS